MGGTHKRPGFFLIGGGHWETLRPPLTPCLTEQGVGSQRSQASVTGSHGWPEWEELARVPPAPQPELGSPIQGPRSLDLRPFGGRKCISKAPHLCLGPTPSLDQSFCLEGYGWAPTERHWAGEHVGCVCVYLCVFICA